MDINLSSDDETMHLLVLDAPVDQKVSTGDDTGDDGATSAEPTTPRLIRSDMLDKSKPYAADQVTVVPHAGGCGRKRPPLATKQSNPIPQAAQVMTQVELPPYHGPRSLLNLLAI
jgi:hypothetical protein